MTNKKITLKTVDGYSISAVHTISESKSIVLWLHGITVNKDEYLNFFKDGASYLAEFGIDSLRIDFRGHGKSDGKSTDFTISGQTMDVDASIKYLRDYYSVKNLKLHLVGCSFGSPPAIIAALDYRDYIDSVTLIAPVIDYRRTFISPETEWAASIFNDKTVSELKKTNKLYINNNFPISMYMYKEMSLIYPENLIGNVNQNLTIIHGASDSMVPYPVSKDLASKFNNIHLVSMKDMDHGFNDKDDEIGKGEKSIENKTSIYENIKKNILAT